MKVLQVNKFFYENGGSERYFFSVSEALTAAGHEVVHFAMADQRNQLSPWSDYFAPHIDFQSTPTPSKALRFISSRQATAQLRRLIAETKPDVAHLHNIAHQLTPSIIGVLKRAGIPVVMTLHDYQVLCPNYKMYTQQRPCQRCKRHSYWNAIRYRCVQNSHLASALSALEMTTQNVVLRNYQKVDRFIAPSQFMHERMLAWGWPAAQVHYLPHFVQVDPPQDVEKKPQVVFAGRLVHEKGAHLVLEVANQFPAYTFLFAGTGEEAERLQFEAERRGLSNCRFLGYVQPSRLQKLIAESQAVVIPSLWYENAPLVAYESLALGTPVVAADHGGLPELIRPGQTGALFAPGDTAGLAKSLKMVLNMGSSPLPSDLFPVADHLQRLTTIYAELQR